MQKLIAEMHARAAATDAGRKSVAWAGRQLVVTNAKVAQLLQSVEQVDMQIANTAGHDEKVLSF